MEKKKKQTPPTAGTDAPTAAPTEAKTAPTTTDTTTPEATTPKRSTPLKIRGTLTVIDPEAHDYEFRAQRSTGQSSQELMKQSGGSKLYRTTGEKQPKMVAHLSVNADSPDPVADLHEQLKRVTKGIGNAEKMPPLLRGRVLLNKDGAIVVYNQRQQTVECRLTFDLKTVRNLQQQLINKMQTLNQCFAINQDTFQTRMS